MDPLAWISLSSQVVGAGTGVGTAVGQGQHQAWATRAQTQAGQRQTAWERVQAQRALLASQRSQALSATLDPATQAIVARQKQQTKTALFAMGAVLALFWLANK